MEACWFKTQNQQFNNQNLIQSTQATITASQPQYSQNQQLRTNQLNSQNQQASITVSQPQYSQTQQFRTQNQQFNNQNQQVIQNLQFNNQNQQVIQNQQFENQNQQYRTLGLSQPKQSSVTFVSQEVSRPVTAGVTTVVSQQQPQTFTQKFSNTETSQQIVSAAQPLQQQYNAQTRIVTQQITPSVYSANKFSQNQQFSQNQYNQNQFDQNQQFSQNQFNNQNDFQGRREISGYLETTSGDRFLGIFKSFYVPETAAVSEESSDFQCSRYGQDYFADPSSGCQKFYVCSPVQPTADAAVQDMWRFTFRCNAGEQFDQQSLSCVRGVSSTCAASPSTYSSTKDRALALFTSYSQVEPSTQLRQNNLGYNCYTQSGSLVCVRK